MGPGVPLFLLLPQEEARHSHPMHPQPPLSLKALPLAPRVPATPCPDERPSQCPPLACLVYTLFLSLFCWSWPWMWPFPPLLEAGT